MLLLDDPPLARTGRAPLSPRRDHAVDAVRALGTLLLVGLHWLMLEASWDGRSLVLGNALAHSSAWMLTWLTPLPLFFFAAGAGIGYSMQRSGPTGTDRPGQLVRRRLARMRRPLLLLAGALAVVAATLLLCGLPLGAVVVGVAICVQPLWFLPVYLVLSAAAPLLQRLPSRVGTARLLAACTIAVVILDIVRMASGAAWLATPNVLLVWAVPFTLGLARASGRLPCARRLWLGVLAGCTAAVIALVALGPYSGAFIGLPGAGPSNACPPTLAMAALCGIQVSLVMLAERWLAAWGARSRFLKRVERHSLALYVWHLPALVLVAGVVLIGLDAPLPEPWSGQWWATYPFLCLAALGVLRRCVRASAPPTPDSRPPSPWRGDSRGVTRRLPWGYEATPVGWQHLQVAAAPRPTGRPARRRRRHPRPRLGAGDAKGEGGAPRSSSSAARSLRQRPTPPARARGPAPYPPRDALQCPCPKTGPKSGPPSEPRPRQVAA